METGIDEEINIKILEEYQTFPGTVGLLNKAIYGLGQAGRCWNSKLCDDTTVIEFEQSKADPCVFRKVDGGEVEMVVVVHVDDILAHECFNDWGRGYDDSVPGEITEIRG